MNGKEVLLVKSLLEQKKFNVVNEYLHISHPERGDIIITEYAGADVRCYKDNGKTKVLYPKDIDVIQEGHVAQAIANGSIFDDAEDVDNNATMIERTSLPYDAMINSGKEPPKCLRPMIAIVIGKMDDTGSCAVSDADRTNGINFIKDLVDTKKEDNDNNINDVVNNYLDHDSKKPYTRDMGKSITELDKEIDNVADTKPEDVISDDDTVDSYDDIDIEDIEAGSDDGEDDIFDEIESISEYFDYDGEGNIFMESKSRERDKTPRNEISQWMEKKGYWYTGDNSKKKKECMRMYHFLQQHKFDPKDETYESDIDDDNGGKKRIKLDIDDNELKKDMKLSKNGTQAYHWRTNDGSVSHTTKISIPSKVLKGKQHDQQITLKHEEGHAASSENKPKDLDTYDKRGDAPEAKEMIDEQLRAGKKISEHDQQTEELMADAYAVKNAKIRTKDWGKNKSTRNINATDIERHFRKLMIQYSVPARQKAVRKAKSILKVLNDLKNKSEIKSNKECEELLCILRWHTDCMTNKQKQMFRTMTSGEIKIHQNEYRDLKKSIGIENKNTLKLLNDLKDLMTKIELVKKDPGKEKYLDKSQEQMLLDYEKATKELIKECEKENKDIQLINDKIKNNENVIKYLAVNELLVCNIADTMTHMSHNIDISSFDKTLINELFEDLKKSGTIDKIISIYNDSIKCHESAIKKIPGVDIKFNDTKQMRVDFSKKYVTEYESFVIDGISIYMESVTEECGDGCGSCQPKPVTEDGEDVGDDGGDMSDSGDVDTDTDSGDTETVQEEGDTITPPTKVPTEGTDAHGNVNTTPMPPSAATKALISSNSKYQHHQEGFLTKKPKKLKPIPRDIIAYITCEMNDIRSANDQAMLAGYTCSKIELVDFYITALDTQDARYIVPHDRNYLTYMKNELERLLSKILRIRPINRADQVWRVNYPTM